jgi:hypothetical protein
MRRALAEPRKSSVALQTVVDLVQTGMIRLVVAGVSNWL